MTRFLRTRILYAFVRCEAVAELAVIVIIMLVRSIDRHVILIL